MKVPDDLQARQQTNRHQIVQDLDPAQESDKVLVDEAWQAHLLALQLKFDRFPRSVNRQQNQQVNAVNEELLGHFTYKRMLFPRILWKTAVFLEVVFDLHVFVLLDFGVRPRISNYAVDPSGRLEGGAA